ncbi:(E)-4-hydroxy-3-methylbut-2-enyl-diphosphate synthase [Flaviaesturariibacter aridisoli]|uniref:4-hydroxy-3-methylbut-2-en-1-yl diphosphate synthase (flavodoxin) n=1 Tax=Flaviaesturariibacter aridisoli TaxID=2545761 RepID=A0A4R4E2T4_9BACT|nr:(E)-4-hydroxy-3-methylbut-2-enyl-diphosphate synthase [Flaviaesturariibacter aridisoli]TCZ73103.1 4-hydroxy-3-methylbut-2-en-1-yl diphosphate synthase [Flaviaesturariibacter aridisoli]
MQTQPEKTASYQRLHTRPVRIGDLWLGGDYPIRIQTMTTTDTMDTEATVAQTIRCIEAGAELVRITAPSKKEAENLRVIRDELHRRGYNVPLVADIHFTPNAAEIAARIVEKVRVNPGNYVDKKKFEQIEYTDTEYAEEIDRIRERFTPLVRICKEHGTAMRIGTNHGSLSDRIMSRYGDTAIGMVESAMEFLRIARSEDYHQIVLSMKSSNPIVMVEAYRLLVRHMEQEFGECYPLHLGVTEAGDGEDGRIKSAIGIGTLLQEGIGDTIRVSLTEDPEFELPVCKDLVKKVEALKNPSPSPGGAGSQSAPLSFGESLSRESGRSGVRSAPPSPWEGGREDGSVREAVAGSPVPVVIADYMHADRISPEDLAAIGYRYSAALDKWNIGDSAADYIYTASKVIDFALPGTLGVICNAPVWKPELERHYPLFEAAKLLEASAAGLQPDFAAALNFIAVDASATSPGSLGALLAGSAKIVLCVYASSANPTADIRAFVAALPARLPVVIGAESHSSTVDEQLIDFATTAGTLLLDGIGKGVWLMNDPSKLHNSRVSGRTYMEVGSNAQFLNNTAFSILQATRTRISKTEYISCPSCGRTLFDLQETTAKIRAVTHHLKGVKIAIMGCIVNGPGEMADADFGYVGSGPGKITLYKGKEVVKRNVPSEVAVEELIGLLKEAGAWVEPLVEA